MEVWRSGCSETRCRCSDEEVFASRDLESRCRYCDVQVWRSGVALHSVLTYKYGGREVKKSGCPESR